MQSDFIEWLNENLPAIADKVHANLVEQMKRNPDGIEALYGD
jgi:hypothetical protein